MKKASELGLELIELEDQVLLVDENSKKQNIINVKINGFRRVFEIIASTKPLEGLPLLVIEDGVENLANQAEIEEIKKEFQSLTKKELWIEVEEKHFRTVKNSKSELIDHQFTIEPKITNNTIKAVWN